METEFTCSKCGELKPIQRSGGTGYAVDRDTDAKTCYACMADVDRAFMREHGRTTLYLSFDEQSKPRALNGVSALWPTHGKVTNWCGTLEFPIHFVRIGRHNMARRRYDVWFDFEGHEWHGVTYGDNTQICHCRRKILHR